MKLLLLQIIVISSIAVSTSCKKNVPEVRQIKVKDSIWIDAVNDTIDLYLGMEQKIMIRYNDSSARNEQYQWKLDKPELVELKNGNLFAVLNPKLKGFVKLEVTNDKTDIKLAYVLNVKDTALKVLGICSSFGLQGLGTFLKDIAKGENKKIVIGVMYYGGATLSFHLNNLKNNNKAYEYFKFGTNTIKETRNNSSLQMALLDEQWDYIATQESAGYSGLYDTLKKSLPVFIDSLKSIVSYKDAKYILHQTWAYENNSTYPFFSFYNNNQVNMYNMVVQTYQKAKELVNADMIVPSGTAIQNGRTSIIGDKFCSDTYHLNNLGCYVISCAWYEKLFGSSVLNTSYKPPLTDNEIKIARHAAHTAAANPNSITSLSDLP